MIEQVEVPDGMVLFPYFVKEEDAELAIKCFAELTPQEYDDDRNPLLSIQDMARKAVTAILDKKITKYQQRQILKDSVIKTNIIH
jgi:hypothetical protein